jgi:amino acid transporter
MTARKDDDARLLSRLGYAQELLRAMGGFSSFALSFSIISVLTGVVSTYGVALRGGGGAGLGLGWPLVCAGTLFVAGAMAELASAFPTAGALYHWSALLGGAGWGWFTAMMNLVGQAAIVAAIDLACAKAIAGVLDRDALAYPLFIAILVTHAALNVASVRLVAWLNDFSATVHVVGIAVIVGLLLTLGRARPLGFLVDTGFTARADGAYPLGFANALLLGMWTMTGFDASAHASEETRDPARRAPWGIVSAVAVSAVVGYALVAALTLSVRDLAHAAAEDGAALYVLEAALGERAGRGAMLLAILAMWFCGLSSVTSAARTLYAFARDGGLPLVSAHVRRVSPRLRTPVVATVLAVAGPLALVFVLAPFQAAVFDAVASLATTALYLSYGLPILLGAVARRRGLWRHKGPWNLGGAGPFVAWIAIGWCAAVLAVGSLPPNGLGGGIFAGAVVFLALLYFAAVRGRFRGPRVDLAAAERGAD